MSKEEALNTARRLVQEAIDVAGSAGIDPALVIAPHFPEAAAMQDGDDDRGSKNLTWGGVPGIIDDSIEGCLRCPSLTVILSRNPLFL